MSYKIETIIDIGDRQTQEDYIYIKKNIKILKNNYDIIGVFDGHNGNECNLLINKYLMYYIDLYQSNPKYSLLTFKIFIKLVFIRLDIKIGKIQNKSGSCVNLVFLDTRGPEGPRNPNYIVNIGDVQSIIKFNSSVYVTPLHNFENPNEMSRFSKNNIKHITKGTKTVMMYKGLSVSRVLGDSDVKDESILNLPEIYEFNDYDEIFIYSDGIKFDSIKDLYFNIDCENFKKYIYKIPEKKDNFTFVKIIQT